MNEFFEILLLLIPVAVYLMKASQTLIETALLISWNKSSFVETCYLYKACYFNGPIHHPPELGRVIQHYQHKVNYVKCCNLLNKR